MVIWSLINLKQSVLFLFASHKYCTDFVCVCLFIQIQKSSSNPYYFNKKYETTTNDINVVTRQNGGQKMFLFPIVLPAS